MNTLKKRMQKNVDANLNNTSNRGFNWMLDSKSDNNKEEQIFNFSLQKSVSLFSKRFQFSVSLTGTKSKENTNVRDSNFH